MESRPAGGLRSRKKKKGTEPGFLISRNPSILLQTAAALEETKVTESNSGVSNIYLRVKASSVQNTGFYFTT